MVKLIRFSDFDGDPVFINPEMVVAINVHPPIPLSKNRPYTIIYLRGNHSVSVIERAQMVEKMISGDRD